MGRLLSLVRDVESSIRSRLGMWMQEVSLAGDRASSDISTLQTDVTQLGADVVQLQVDVTAPGWLAAYLTQTAWYVNSVTGNDANDAATALTPIKTLAELARRWDGRTFGPSVTAVSVNLAGSFQGEQLIIAAEFVAPQTTSVVTEVTVTGAVTQVDAGTITAFQAWNSAADLRGQLTDAAQDFTAHIRRRVRITDGAALGAVTWIGSLGGGATVANVGRFRTGGPGFTGTLVNPAPGAAYVIETIDTKVRGYDVDCPGARVTLRDISIAPAASIIATATSRQSQGNLKLFGCEYVCPAGGNVQLHGSGTPISCAFKGTATAFPFESKEGFWNTKSLCGFWPIWHYNQMVQRDSTYFDGNGEIALDQGIEQGATVYEQTFCAIFSALGGACLMRVSNSAFWFQNSSYLWGSGSTTTVPVQVTNSSGLLYTAGFKPKITAATPTSDIQLAGAAAIAWAAVPAAGVAPDNAICIEKR